MPFGLCWAKDQNDRWNLVEIRDASYRPDSWFEKDEPKVEIFSMGWDCPEHAHVYKEFVRAEIIDPSGKRY
jgi:hypothetical protein